MNKYDKEKLDTFERRIWELEQAMMQTNPAALREARDGVYLPRMPPDERDAPSQQPQPGQQTPQAPQAPSTTGDKP